MIYSLEQIKKYPNLARWFINKKSGGLNPCIIVKNSKDSNGVVDNDLDTLGNCVAYATGMFNLVSGQTECKYLGNTNAKNMINLAKSQGLTITDAPVPNGCMVWDDGKYGHIEFVERVDGDISYNSSSAYATYILADKVRKKNVGGNNQWGWKLPTKYLGCINPPKITETNQSSPSEYLVLELNGKKYKIAIEEIKD